VAPTGDASGQDSGTVVTVAVAGGSTLLALLAFAAVVPLAKRTRRRRRLARGTPAQRIEAAWAEVLTGLRLAGRPAPPHLTASEVAHYATTAATGRAHSKPRRVATIRSATPPVDDVAALVNTVAFAGPQTVRGLPAGPGEEQATRAAVQAVAYVEELRARRGFWRRLRWTLDPRPLFWK
jgi:hypothetical protein